MRQGRVAPGIAATATGRAGEGELQCGGLDGRTVPLGQLPDAPDGLQDAGRSRLVLEMWR